ncbi:MAG: HNH endonuclease [Planctomycetes bacterium]|nr:HNH endonuclease [Planctomycetota bacterium]
MARPDLTELYQLLMDARYEFMGVGEFALAEIYRTVKERYPELCDDSYLCKTNCQSGHNHPEWMHRVRAALDQLKNRPGSGITKQARRHYWYIGGSAPAAGSADDPGFPEGRQVMRLHLRKERNRKAVRRKKQRVLATTGRLCCEVCTFDFRATYGDLGDGFAECHHRVPLAELTEEYRIRLSELAIVCANCHRMLHRRRNLKVEELRAVMHAQVITQPKQD